MSDPELPRIAFFAHERGDARVVKRITALEDHGWKVIGFTFHRIRDKEEVPPEWENIHLGTTFNRRYFQRLWAFVKCTRVLWRERRRLAGCAVIYAVNTDNALLAGLARWFVGSAAPLVLELADIQPVMTGGGLVSRTLRAIERFVLKRTALLVTTSPGFVRRYFQPVQRVEGGIFLLENKVYPSGGLPECLASSVPMEQGRPWVVGCFGALRCRRSLVLMRELAAHPGGRVRFVLRGYPAGTIAEDFENLSADADGVDFGGAYVYPDDLAAMYERIDFNWVFDESDSSGNSAWLLPNRIYEGGCFGVPAIARKHTETGDWIERNGLGWTFDEPLEDHLAAFFKTLQRKEWEDMKRNCLSHPRAGFTGEADYAELSDRLRKLPGQLMPAHGEPG